VVSTVSKRDHHHPSPRMNGPLKLSLKGRYEQLEGRLRPLRLENSEAPARPVPKRWPDCFGVEDSSSSRMADVMKARLSACTFHWHVSVRTGVPGEAAHRKRLARPTQCKPNSGLLVRVSWVFWWCFKFRRPSGCSESDGVVGAATGPENRARFSGPSFRL
jgi:hypothetical protein